WSALPFCSEDKMTRTSPALIIVLGLAVSNLFGGPATIAPLEATGETEETKWEYSLSIVTYLAQHARDYANPNFTADRDWLHLEARGPRRISILLPSALNPQGCQVHSFKSPSAEEIVFG